VSPSSPSCVAFTNAKRSLDGYIRITFDAFSSLNFQRKLAWEDKGLRHDLIVDDIPASCAGYCEWATDETPDQVSIGWAWFSLADGRIFIAPGGISSNVMLVTQASYDLGMHKTNELLQAWLAGEVWQPNAPEPGPAALRCLT
jgi:hypothetical protein